MTKHDAYKAILQRFIAQWPTLSSGVPYVFDNDVADETATFVRFSLQPLVGDQMTLGPPGNRKYLREGLIRAKITGPIAAGRKNVDALGQHIRTIFEGVRFGLAGLEEGVVTFSSYDDETESDATSWILVVTVPFEYYEPR